MDGGKDGKADAKPMLEYGDKALALQKEQYDYSKQISQPWLNTGTSAINQLSTLMGLSGGGNQSRQSFYDKLAPQYTNTINATQSPTGGWYVGAGGKMVNVDDPNSYADYIANYKSDMAGKAGGDRYQTGHVLNWLNQAKKGGAYNDYYGQYKNFGLTPFQTTQSSPTVDTAGLNAAVDAAYNNQTADGNFGKLLQNYTGQDIYNDPSYQFRLGQGQKAMERQLAASGKYLTPAASQALMELGQNMGSQEYQNAYNRFNNDQNNLYNRLANLSGMGQTQSGQVIGAGQNYANAGSDIYTGMGNAITAANQVNNSKPSMFSTLGGTVFSGKTPWGNLW